MTTQTRATQDLTAIEGDIAARAADLTFQTDSPFLQAVLRRLWLWLETQTGAIVPVAATPPQLETIVYGPGDYQIAAEDYFTFSIVAVTGTFTVESVGGATQTFTAGTAISGFTVSHPAGTVFNTAIDISVTAGSQAYATREFY